VKECLAAWADVIASVVELKERRLAATSGVTRVIIFIAVPPLL
jgi:hypothetical protein